MGRKSAFVEAAVVVGMTAVLIGASGGLAQAAPTGDSEENVCITYRQYDSIFDTHSEGCVFTTASATVLRIAAAAYDRNADGRSAVNYTRILQFDASNNPVKETDLDAVVSSEGKGWSNLSQTYSIVKEQSAVRYAVGVRPCSLDIDGEESNDVPNTLYCDEQWELPVAQLSW